MMLTLSTYSLQSKSLGGHLSEPGGGHESPRLNTHAHIHYIHQAHSLSMKTEKLELYHNGITTFFSPFVRRGEERRGEVWPNTTLQASFKTWRGN